MGSLPGEVFQQAKQFVRDCEIIKRESIPKRLMTEKETMKTQFLNEFREERMKTAITKNEKLSGPGEDIYYLVSTEMDGNPNHNSNGYLVATQDDKLSKQLRELPNVPQIHLSHGILLLESPSSASRRYSMKEENGKRITGGGNMTEHEKYIICKNKKREREIKLAKIIDRGFGNNRRHRKSNGPNPLSCKKKNSRKEPKKRKRWKKLHKEERGV